MGTDRREQGKAARRARIVAVATELFAQRGYDHVTTREVAKAAEVGMGTLFRHAGSKPALLVQVMNELLDEGALQASALVAAGASLGRAAGALGRAAGAMVAPLVTEGAGHVQNLRAYQRESLFGPPDLRLMAVEHVTMLEATFAQLLGSFVPSRPDVDPVELSRLVSAVVTMELIRAGAGRLPVEEVVPRVERSVDLVVAGLVERPS